MEKPRILIINDYFSPATQAGGIVRSLSNLCHTLSDEFEFFVLSSNRELDGSTLPVPVNVWIKKAGGFKVTYSQRVFNSFLKIFRENSFDAIYVNGIFSLGASILPLLFLSFQPGKSRARIIVAPRGMLQPGALSSKAFKKKIFLQVFRQLVSKQIIWHATDEEEVRNIQQQFPDSQVRRAHNIPSVASSAAIRNKRVEEKTRFVYLSLLAEKKNLHLLIEQLGNLLNEGHDFQLDIYGPIKDQAYWQKCQAIISSKGLYYRIRYRGAVSPEQVFEVLQKYHFFVLPTKGENFGHAIFEALKSGFPVIISDQTPWSHVSEEGAGFVFPIEKEQQLGKVLKAALDIHPDDYEKMSRKALSVAEKYIQQADFKASYKQLFA